MTMPMKMVGDQRLCFGTRLMMVILWGRSPNSEGKVVLDKRAITVTLNVANSTMNRYIRQACSVGWLAYDSGVWWLRETCEEMA